MNLCVSTKAHPHAKDERVPLASRPRRVRAAQDAFGMTQSASKPYAMETIARLVIIRTAAPH